MLFVVLNAGCGLVSGLDTLHLGDDASAPEDATVDATSDASDASDARPDGGVGADANAAVDGAGIQCGPQICSAGQVCCVSSSGNTTYTCAKDNCGIGVAFTLRCDDKSDCTNLQQVCCWSNNAASCGLVGGSCIPLCNSSTQCTGTSQCVPFDAGNGLSLMRCQ